MAKILVAEDDAAISELMVWNLGLVGHTATPCDDGKKALAMAASGNYDLVLLDVMLPELSGFDVKQQLPTGQPVIFVTAKTSLPSRLQGLGLGADDYITKPFEMLELLARVEAVLRRTGSAGKTFSLGDTVVELQARCAYHKGVPVELTPKEFTLLETLVNNRNLALSREKLLELVWGYDYDGEDRTVDVHIQRLRKKLGWEKEIQTVFKYGYRLQTKE